jgi:hypothetical protein
MSLFQTLSSYDPRTIDTKYVQEVSNQIPKNGHIEIDEAERLSIIFLECADRITDEIARCSAYVGYCEAARRETKATAIDDRMNGKEGVKPVAATIAAQLFGNDPVYKASHEKQALGEAFLAWLQTKYRNLMAAHVLCKDLLKIYQSSKEQGNWKGAHPHDLEDSSESRHSESDRTTSSDDKAVSPGADAW